MKTEIIQDKSITSPKKRLLIIGGGIVLLIVAWIATGIATRNSLYHQ